MPLGPFKSAGTYRRKPDKKYGITEQYGISSAGGGNNAPSPAADNSILHSSTESDDILWGPNANDFLLWS